MEAEPLFGVPLGVVCWLISELGTTSSLGDDGDRLEFHTEHSLLTKLSSCNWILVAVVHMANSSTDFVFTKLEILTALPPFSHLTFKMFLPLVDSWNAVMGPNSNATVSLKLCSGHL